MNRMEPIREILPILSETVYDFAEAGFLTLELIPEFLRAFVLDKLGAITIMIQLRLLVCTSVLCKVNNGYVMKTLGYLCSICFLASVLSANCQVYSTNIVGYYTLQLYTGDNLIANQLDAGTVPDNTLSAIFQLGVVPEGATFTEWDPTTQQYLPTSVYDTVTGWSIDYTLGFGQGGLLHSPSSFMNTFVGSVWSGFNPNTDTWVPPLVTGSGSQLLSCYIPITNATFYAVVGRDPQNGESVTWLNAASQTYTTTTFENGAWNNGVPALNIGQSAYFDLVPEPSVIALSCLALPLVFAGRKRIIRQRRQA